MKKARAASYNIQCNADGTDYLHHFQGVTESDAPSEIMDSNGWKGNFHHLPGQEHPVSLTMEQLLLRVCCVFCLNFVAMSRMF
jgi:hypothetical protein